MKDYSFEDYFDYRLPDDADLPVDPLADTELTEVEFIPYDDEES